jgi:hypothetical protein
MSLATREREIARRGRAVASHERRRQVIIVRIVCIIWFNGGPYEHKNRRAAKMREQHADGQAQTQADMVHGAANVRFYGPRYGVRR